ncbi:hypothetical protein LG3211_3521 [Lysobacter gummosus]|nr:hypothetical protein LG3211_3521 [Lysobacter gummosus]
MAMSVRDDRSVVNERYASHMRAYRHILCVRAPDTATRFTT